MLKKPQTDAVYIGVSTYHAHSIAKLASTSFQHELQKNRYMLKRKFYWIWLNENIWSRKKSRMIKTAYVTYSLATSGQNIFVVSVFCFAWKNRDL